MLPNAKQQRSANATTDSATRSFAGFEPLTANYVYCPNQFFDVCLPSCSRGAVRLVAYLLRRTLGWLDRNGLPVEQDISVPYRELINDAGVSRGAIRDALDEAIEGDFIECVEEGSAHTKGAAATSSSFRLRWDHGERYADDPKAFRGFFAGEGYRTPIPNAFFDFLVPAETLAVVKVVGVVLRHTIGYRNQFGGRRSDAPFSYSFLQESARLRGRAAVANAVRRATEAGYIRCVEEGRFDSVPGNRRPARYAVRWLEDAAPNDNGSKSEPANAGKQFKKRTSIGSETEPAKRFKKRTDRKTSSNNTSKQQRAAALDLLREVGFDERVAKRLSKSSPLPEIERQIAWIEKRGPSRNRLGMLRRAIEESWEAPAAGGDRQAQPAFRERSKQQEAVWVENHAIVLAQDRKRRRQRHAQRTQWQSLSPSQQRHYYERAIEQATSDAVRSRLRSRDFQNPPPEVLALIPCPTLTA